MLTRERTDLKKLDAIALRVDNRRKRQNYWQPHSFEVTPDGAGLIRASTNARVSTVANWFEEEGALVLGIVTDDMREAVAVTFKAAKP